MGGQGSTGSRQGTAYEAREAAKAMWQQRIQEIEVFLEAKARWRHGDRRKEDEILLGYPTRPSLRKIYDVLVEIEEEPPKTGLRRVNKDFIYFGQ